MTYNDLSDVQGIKHGHWRGKIHHMASHSRGENSSGEILPRDKTTEYVFSRHVVHQYNMYSQDILPLHFVT